MFPVLLILKKKNIYIVQTTFILKIIWEMAPDVLVPTVTNISASSGLYQRS